ncbi:alpha/beta fold hydrolase [Bradyrhizobium sp. 14AA]
MSMNSSEPAAAGFLVREIGSFHTGGRQITLSGLPAKTISFTEGMEPFQVDPNGELEVEQMYVQYVKLVQPKSKLPILLWHGGSMSGVTWETKPDGEPGWQQFFLRAGYDTYVSDAVERGRASWATYPGSFEGEPMFRTKKQAWEVFRIGPSYETGGKRKAFENTQFPVEAFDQLAKQAVPRWTTSDAPTQAAYDALVQKLGACIIIAHSQGGNFAYRAALNAPDHVKAVVAIEPSGAPDPTQIDLARLKGIPHLTLFGDFLANSKLWQTFVEASMRYHTALSEAGVAATWLDLPGEGIHGNSHLPMMDRNSDVIAQRVLGWIANHVTSSI